MHPLVEDAVDAQGFTDANGPHGHPPVRIAGDRLG